MFERLSGEPIYNTSAVAQRTGVPADTFRAWERRYGLPRPGRTSGNQRLYSERDIATVAWLREQTGGGLTISQAVQLYRRNAANPVETSRGFSELTLPRHGVAPPDPALTMGLLAGRLLEALLAMDGPGADRVVDEALAVGTVESICVDLLQPTLHEIGRRWHEGTASVAVEHFGSAFAERKLAALFNQSNPNQGRGPLVAACVAGERHHLGLLTSAVLLSRAGFAIIYLGEDLPLPDLLDCVRRVEPAMVLLAASRTDTAETLRGWVEELRRPSEDRPMPVVAFGGGAFRHDPELRASVDAVYLGHDARAAVLNAERIFANLPVVVE